MPATGDIVHVRSRRYLVDDVLQPAQPGSPLVRLSCLEDNSLGQELQVLWDHEIEARVLGQSGCDHVATAAPALGAGLRQPSRVRTELAFEAGSVINLSTKSGQLQRFIEDYSVANRQKASGIAHK